MRGARNDCETVMRYLKPRVMGQDPLERERLYQGLIRQFLAQAPKQYVTFFGYAATNTRPRRGSS